MGLRRFLNTSVALAGFLSLALSAGQAQAGFTVVLDSSALNAGTYLYSYSITIASDDVVRTGDFFRIYDFYGYVAGSITPPNANWTASVANSNPTPPPNVLLSLGDDPAVPNLIFTYTGVADLNQAGVAGLAFTARSLYPESVPANFKNFAGRNTKSTDGSAVDSVGTLRVPGVPEPTSVLSTSLGVVLLGAAFAYRNRRRLATPA